MQKGERRTKARFMPVGRQRDTLRPETAKEASSCFPTAAIRPSRSPRRRSVAVAQSSLTFLGAAGTVTGSKHLIENGGERLLLDCGLFQGTPEIEAGNTVPLPFRPSSLGAVVVTHGHLDHVGYLPKLVRDGYDGPIYCTPATAGVMHIVLEDAAKLQERLAARGFDHERARRLLYDADDVASTMRLVRTVPLETPFSAAGATIRFHGAGHILGAAFVEAHVGETRLVFSGDLGRYDNAVFRDPTPLSEADIVLCESTYGDHDHAPDAEGILERMLMAALARGGPVILPAFAVERTQTLLAAIGRLQRTNPALAALAVHVDSPMAARANHLFSLYPEAHKTVGDGATFGCRNLREHVTTEDSKELNRLREPAIIIASSGMANGGRILYHLHRRLPDPTATVIFVGHQVQGTLGRTIIDGAEHVHLFGERLAVRAHVDFFDAFSAHADQSELVRWLGTLSNKPRMYAVHGDAQAATALCTAVRDRLGFDTHVAARAMTISL